VIDGGLTVTVLVTVVRLADVVVVTDVKLATSLIAPFMVIEVEDEDPV
jgi:hypothetical protein